MTIGYYTLPVIKATIIGGLEVYRPDTSSLGDVNAVNYMVIEHDGAKPGDLSDATEALCYVEIP